MEVGVPCILILSWALSEVLGLSYRSYKQTKIKKSLTTCLKQMGPASRKKELLPLSETKPL
jgi:hypothetical protein